MRTCLNVYRENVSFNTSLGSIPNEYIYTCEVSTHFSENRGVHAFDLSTNKAYDDSLKSQLEVIIIEQVDVSSVASDNKSRLKECKRREWHWQNQLKTLRQYGGMNVREERS